VVKKTTTTTKKAKHRAGACRSKVYVYYDEFKVIF
jgi:ubiquitin